MWKWYLSFHPRRISKKKQALPSPGPGHNRSSSRQMGVDVNEAPSRTSRMGMDPSLSEVQTTPLAIATGVFLLRIQGIKNWLHRVS